MGNDRNSKASGKGLDSLARLFEKYGTFLSLFLFIFYL